MRGCYVRRGNVFGAPRAPAIERIGGFDVELLVGERRAIERYLVALFRGRLFGGGTDNRLPVIDLQPGAIGIDSIQSLFRNRDLRTVTLKGDGIVRQQLAGLDQCRSGNDLHPGINQGVRNHAHGTVLCQPENHAGSQQDFHPSLFGREYLAVFEIRKLREPGVDAGAVNRYVSLDVVHDSGMSRNDRLRPGGTATKHHAEHSTTVAHRIHLCQSCTFSRDASTASHARMRFADESVVKLRRRAYDGTSTRLMRKHAAVIAAVYLAATPLTVWITAAGLPVSLATGVALAALLTVGTQYWPAILAAGWLSAIASGYSPLAAGPLALRGLIEALAGGARITAPERPEQSPGDTARGIFPPLH